MDAATAEEIRLLNRRVDKLTELLLCSRTAGLRATDHSALRVVLSAFSEARPGTIVNFTARDAITFLQKYSPADLATLRAAIGGSENNEHRRLGKLLARCEGAMLGGLRLVRLGAIRDGALWGAERV